MCLECKLSDIKPSLCAANVTDLATTVPHRVLQSSFHLCVLHPFRCAVLSNAISYRAA
eukprot:m.150422 g.150422  ORF g.150422 m.150422 type:complete len:58 (+) comp23299_c3_seq1:751-924(+)